MFHVQQPRPALQHAHTLPHSHSHSQHHHYTLYEPVHSVPVQPSSSAMAQLPRSLSRPAHHEVQVRNIVALEPKLEGCSREYIRTKLREKSDDHLRMVMSVSLPRTLQRSQIPQEQYMNVRSSHPNASSLHILAVFNVKAPPQDPSPAPADTAYIFATHMLNLAAHCAHLPRLARPTPRLYSDGSLDLPVVQLNVPHAEAFAPLLAYLVTHRADRLLGALVPVPPAMISPSRGSHSAASLGGGALAHVSAQQLAAALVRDAPGDKRASLMSLVHQIKSVWRNVCALGCYDRDLWEAIDLAWEAVFLALHIAAGGK